MITVVAIYGGGTVGNFNKWPMWGSLKVKITHGKKGRSKDYDKS